MAQKSGKQEIRLTFDFIDHDDPDKSQHNEYSLVDDRNVIGVVQAVAILPGLILMNENFQKLARMKAVDGNPALADFLNSVSG